MDNLTRIKENLLILRGFLKSPPRTQDECALFKVCVSDLSRALNTIEELLWNDDDRVAKKITQGKLKSWRKEIKDDLNLVILPW